MSWCSLHGENDMCDKAPALERELSILRVRLAAAEKVIEAAEAFVIAQTAGTPKISKDGIIENFDEVMKSPVSRGLAFINLNAALREWEGK